MIYGPTTFGNAHFDVAADTVVLGDPIELPTPQFLNRAGFVADGLGAAPGTQLLRGAVYTDGGTLVAAGDTVTIAEDQPTDRVWVPFSATGGRVLPAGRYRAAVHTGAVGEHTRIWTSGMPATGTVVLSPTEPAGPCLWVQTDPAGNPVRVVVKTTGPGTPSAAGIALFVQDSAPLHPGPYVWVRTLDGARITVTTKTTGAGSPTGDALLFIGGDRPPMSFPSLWARTDPASGALLLDAASEPAPLYPFAAGPPPNVPIAGSITVPMVLETTEPLRVPTDVDDDYYATLPWDLTQRVFGLTNVTRAGARPATVGWYGRKFDPTNGAHAIVRADGPLADLVGERIRITRRTPTRTRAIAVYVHDERDFPDEIQADVVVTRRAFLGLGNPALDHATTTVEVLT